MTKSHLLLLVSANIMRSDASRGIVLNCIYSAFEQLFPIQMCQIPLFKSLNAVFSKSFFCIFPV